MARVERSSLPPSKCGSKAVDFTTGANAKWSKLFFGQHRPIAALADAVALEATIFSYINSARKVDRTAACAFVPYAAWIAFATVLNAEMVRRNFLRA